MSSAFTPEQLAQLATMVDQRIDAKFAEREAAAKPKRPPLTTDRPLLETVIKQATNLAPVDRRLEAISTVHRSHAYATPEMLGSAAASAIAAKLSNADLGPAFPPEAWTPLMTSRR